MSNNPYAAPEAVLEGVASRSIALYSPNQAAMGAFLGGPVGLIYFLYRNFQTLEKPSAARNCLIIGVAVIVALAIILPLLPAKFPGTPLTIAYVVIARSIAEKYQMSKQAIIDTEQYTFKSNWNVFGMGLLCFLGSVIFVIGPYVALRAFGVGN
jgi:hypothetical protein